MAEAYRDAAPPEGWWDCCPAWALAVLVAAVYGPALQAGFIWDDDVHFAANPRMLSLRGLIEIWTTRWAVYYPLTSTTFWILRRAADLTPWVYHAFTLGLHIAVALLFARLLRALRIPGAMLAAAIFALHPVQVESVAWVTELKNTQSALFLMLSALALVRSGLLPDNRLIKRRWFSLSLAGFLAALLSKPSVVVFPAVLLVYLWWRRLLRGPRDARWLAPFAAAALLMALWTIWEQQFNSGASGFEWNPGFLDRVVTAGRIATFHFGRLVWPDPLMFIYPDLRLSASEPRAWLPLLAVLVALAGIGVNSRDWGRPVLAAALGYLLFLAPVLGFFNVYFMRYAQVADHFQYLALLPASAFAGAFAARAGAWAAGRRIARPLLNGALCAALASYGFLAWRHTHAFQSDEQLWRDTVAKNPRAWIAQNNLGLIHWDRGRHGEAERHFRAALAANPRHYEALCNLGAALARRGRIVEARRALEQAIHWQPMLPQAWFNLGRVHEKTGDWTAAEKAFLRTLELQPAYAEAHARLAIRAEDLDDPVRALRHHREALELATPDRREGAKFLNQRTARFISRQRWRMARAFLDASLEMDPQFEETRQLEFVWRNLLPESGDTP